MVGFNLARAWLAPAIATACVIGVGCAADNMGTSGSGGGAGVGGMAGMAGEAGMAGMAGMGGSAACFANETRACTCVDGNTGRAVCNSAAIWSLCECAASGAGAGGGTPFDPSLNPPGNSRADIMFSWQETVTDNCLPGHYEGTFNCMYVPMGGDPSMGTPVSGPIAMTLTQSANGEFLEISDGTLNGNTYGIINFTSMLTGRLNCATREFGAQAVMGLWGPLFPVNPFDGVLSAHYDDLTSTLTGDWALTEGLTMGICSGPWNAHRVGP
jgi:hypothetical protein